MAPMKNSQYFNPMQHRLLTDIRKYSLLTSLKTEFYTFVKPEGIDVFIKNGQIFDLNQRELHNNYLKFHFEKLLDFSRVQKAVVIGVLVSTNTNTMLAHRYSLYSPSKAIFEGLKFLTYDVIFPVFDADHIFKWRYSIADKAVGIFPNCETLSRTLIKNEHELGNIVRDAFETDVSSSVLIYDTEGKFVPGESQLLWNDAEAVSYEVKANQRYRGHIKRIVSTTKRYDNGDKVELASYIIARFKKEYINIPINSNNIALRSFLWKHREDLKSFPFWFTGYTYLDEVVNSMEYVTVVNEFLSFIPKSDVCR